MADETTELRRATDVLDAAQIRALTRPSNLAGVTAVVVTWGSIAACLALVAVWPNPLTIIISLVLLGGRHLALAVLTHEAAHRSLFASRSVNDWVGRWLCAAPAGNHLDWYREHHLAHHAHTGTERDPDRSLSDPFPVTRRTLARKLLRDISGATGVRRVGALLLMDLGILRYTAAASAARIDQTGRRPIDYLRAAIRNTGPAVLTNALLLGLLVALGQPWLFLLWIGAYLTTYSVVLRIRSIAEHACTRGGPNPFHNTRTTHASWLARIVLAPLRVNFHIEHHLLMTVPHHRLPQFHALLVERGALAQSEITPGYRAVLRIASSP
ncbi:MAG: fatty acid desaturase family protein [Deltaproteobacteria bacterium]|nr:fatty acid desaturase family protein [Deltaproteobacteria bacterium]